MYHSSTWNNTTIKTKQITEGATLRVAPTRWLPNQLGRGYPSGRTGDAARSDQCWVENAGGSCEGDFIQGAFHCGLIERPPYSDVGQFQEICEPYLAHLVEEPTSQLPTD